MGSTVTNIPKNLYKGLIQNILIESIGRAMALKWLKGKAAEGGMPKESSFFVVILPLLVLLVLFPYPVAFKDAWSFNGHPEFTVLLLLSVFLLFCVPIYFAMKRRLPGIQYVEPLCFAVALTFLFNDRFFDFQTGEMLGTRVKHFPTHKIQTNSILELSLTVLILVFGIWLFRKKSSLIRLFCKIVFFVGLVNTSLQVAVNYSAFKGEGEGLLEKFPVENPDADKSPVVLIIMDRLDTRDFVRGIKESSGFKESLSDFTFFPDNFTPYKWTDLAIPSLLHGEILPMNQPLRGYLSYFVGQYADEYFENHWDFAYSGLEHGEVHVDKVTMAEVKFHFVAGIHLMDFMLLKAVPGPFHHLWDGWKRGPMASLLNILPWNKVVTRSSRLNLNRMDWMIDSWDKLPDGGWFLIFHSNLTHNPFFRTSNCQLQSQIFVLKNEEESHRSHVDCGLRKLTQLLQELKSQQYYKRSAVVLISDHGHFNQRERAVLAVKWPGDSNNQEMRVSTATTSLVDVKDIMNILISGKQKEVVWEKVIPSRKVHVIREYDPDFFDNMPKQTGIQYFHYTDPEWREFLNNHGINAAGEK